MTRLLIIDGQGGKLGRQLVERVRARVPDADIACVGTNVAATAAMLKAGASRGATGENAVIVGCKRADVIAGPIGILCADALLGEITPRMAAAVGQSEAAKVLVPVAGCQIVVAGTGDTPLARLVEDAAERIACMLTESMLKS